MSNTIQSSYGHWIGLLVVPKLPSHILCPGKKYISDSNQINRINNVSPCNEFALSRPIHEGPKFLNEVVETLGALVEKLVDELAGLAEVRQLVQVAVILGVGGGDHLQEGMSTILNGFVKEQLSRTPSKTAPGSNCIFFPMMLDDATCELCQPRWIYLESKIVDNKLDVGLSKEIGAMILETIGRPLRAH